MAGPLEVQFMETEILLLWFWYVPTLCCCSGVDPLVTWERVVHELVCYRQFSVDSPESAKP
jgi:hypothetical protein